MKYTKKENYTEITPTEATFSDFFEVFSNEFSNFKNEHLFLNFLNFSPVSIVELDKFSETSMETKENGNSFILIAEGIDIDELEDENLSVVPTLGEAEDTLEMDNIERDLLG
ncbi:hypothetical protein ACFLRU_06350 [Bacteroidota bacterium]